MKFARFRILSGVFWALTLCAAAAQSVTTTTVQGTVYSASGAPVSGTLQLSWPAFSTAANQAIAAGRITVAIGVDGFLSVNIAPNQGAVPAGLYYTAVYHLSDGTTSTEYWTVPATAQAALAQVRAQLMPAAQAVQAVSKAYVDQAILQNAQSQISSFGGTLSGPLYLNGDPSMPTQAADKHYVDQTLTQALPVGGGIAQGPLTATQLGAVYQADQSAGTDFGSKLQSCINNLDSTYGGTCDARNFSGSLDMSAPLTIAKANVTVQLPCATIATSNSIVIAPGTRNVTLHGCATRGTSSASGSQGGTVFLYSGSAALFQVGDSNYAANTLGFHLDNVVLNTTAAIASTAQALTAWRTQEMHLDSLYLLGNGNQTGLTLDGTGNYTGGTIEDIEIGGFEIALNAIGHQTANSATTDWLNASTFLRVHIDCPTSSGNPIAGTIGINLQQGDGNTFTGGDVEGCGTALHLGANAQNNTIVGLRNENSTSQVVADTGSAYNNWITGGTMFTGKLTDNGTRNSFLDTFHRSFNALNGDWYGSQQDATVTNHFRVGIGTGTERGLLNRYQTDYGYRWTTGLSDAANGEQDYQVLDELNNVNRLSIGQYNHGQSSTNNQTVLNSAGTGSIVLNGSNNAGTGGVVIGSGGAASSTVATVDKSGNAQFNGALQIGGSAQSTGTMTVRNNADAEVDYYLWPGLTASQKGAFTYKDYNGNSQWYLVKDSKNNWALNSALGGLDSFKAYQSTNSGDTYVNASNSSGHIRLNYESGSGAETDIYSGSSSSLAAAFLSPTAIKLPGLAASSGHNCIQIDNSGYLSNAGAACGTASSVASAGLTFPDASLQTTSQQGALTGAANDATARAAAAAAQNTAAAAIPASGGAMTGPLTGVNAAFSGTVAGGTTTPTSIDNVGVHFPDGSTQITASIIVPDEPTLGGYSWAQLKAMKRAHLTGYNTGSTAGGGDFVWKDTPTIPDSVTSISGSDDPYGAHGAMVWASIEEIYVDRAGAIGDGITDNCTALTKAHNAQAGYMGAWFQGAVHVGDSTEMDVSTVEGFLQIGDIVTGTGLSSGTTIVSQVSGIPGGPGTYKMNKSNSVTDGTQYLTAVAAVTQVVRLRYGPFNYATSCSLHLPTTRVFFHVTGTAETTITQLTDNTPIFEMRPVNTTQGWTAERFKFAWKNNQKGAVALVSTNSSDATKLDVSSVLYGTLAVGQTIVAGVNTPGITIVSQVSGAPGGAGTYQLSATTSISSVYISAGFAGAVGIEFDPPIRVQNGSFGFKLLHLHFSNGFRGVAMSPAAMVSAANAASTGWGFCTWQWYAYDITSDNLMTGAALYLGGFGAAGATVATLQKFYSQAGSAVEPVLSFQSMVSLTTIDVEWDLGKNTLFQCQSCTNNENFDSRFENDTVMIPYHYLVTTSGTAVSTFHGVEFKTIYGNTGPGQIGYGFYPFGSTIIIYNFSLDDMNVGSSFSATTDTSPNNIIISGVSSNGKVYTGQSVVCGGTPLGTITGFVSGTYGSDGTYTLNAPSNLSGASCNSTLSSGTFYIAGHDNSGSVVFKDFIRGLNFLQTGEPLYLYNPASESASGRIMFGRTTEVNLSQTGVAANQTSVPLISTGGAKYQVMQYIGGVVRLSACAEEPITSGTITLTVSKAAYNSTSNAVTKSTLGRTLTLDSTHQCDYVMYSLLNDPFVGSNSSFNADDRIGANITTSSSFAPADSSQAVYVKVTNWLEW